MERPAKPAPRVSAKAAAAAAAATAAGAVPPTATRPAPLVGNVAVRSRLSRAALDQRLHHCFVFEGPEGVGKFSFAMQFAMEINCLAPASGQDAGARPCGVCDQCRWITSGAHPDVIVVKPDPERATPIISAAQAREIVGSLQLQRHSARYRVIILSPADAMNEEAANILLKTLEEPPAGTQFILVTSRPAALLPTVRSRSQRVRFGPLTAAEMATWLASRGLDPALAGPAAGSPGRALGLVEGDGAQRAEIMQGLCDTVGKPLYVMFAFTEATSKKLEGGSERGDLVLQLLEELLADTVAVASGRPPAHADRLPMLQGWARALWPGGVGRLQVEIGLARERLRSNVPARIVLEALLAHLNLELHHAGTHP